MDVAGGMLFLGGCVLLSGCVVGASLVLREAMTTWLRGKQDVAKALSAYEASYQSHRREQAEHREKTERRLGALEMAGAGLGPRHPRAIATVGG